MQTDVTEPLKNVIALPPRMKRHVVRGVRLKKTPITSETESVAGVTTKKPPRVDTENSPIISCKSVLKPKLPTVDSGVSTRMDVKERMDGWHHDLQTKPERFKHTK